MAQNTIANAWVQLMPSADGMQRNIEREMGGPLDRSGRDGGRRFGGAMGGAIGGLASTMFAPLAAAAAAIGFSGFIGDALEEAREAEKVGALTANAIKVTGSAANVTAEQVGALATAISNKTGVDDEAIQSASNLLLTFKNVRNEAGEGANVFDRATQAAADLSAAGFGDMNGTAKQLGKALNDPIAGISALGRAGVTFTDQQKDQIKAMVEAGDTLGAQQIILAEVEAQVGGAAEASATAGEKMSVAFGNLKEQIGTALLPAVDRLAGFLTATVIPAISTFIAQFSDGGGKLRPFIDAITGAYDIIAKGDFTGLGFEGISDDSPIVGFLFQVRDALIGLGGFITGTAVPAFKELAAVVGPIIVGYLKSMAAFVQSTVLPALSDIGGFIVANVIPALVEFGGFIGAKLLPALSKIGSFILTSVLPALQSIYSTVIATVVPVLKSLWETFEANILPALQNFFAIVTDKVVPVLIKVGEALLPVITTLAKFVGTILTTVIPVILNVAGPVFGFLINAIGKVIGWIADFIGWLVDAGKSIQQWAQPAIARFVEFKDKAVAAFLEMKARGEILFNQIKAFVLARVADIVGVVSQIIAFKDRVVGTFTALRDEVISRVTAFVGEVRAIPGKALEALGSMASLLRQKGKDLIQGLIDGIKDKIQAVKNAVSDVAGAIGDFFPGSPVKEGPLKSWNKGGAGKRLVGMLADGLSDTRALEAASRGLASNIAAPTLGAGVGAGATAGGSGVTFYLVDADGVLMGSMRGVYASEARRTGLVAAQVGV